MSSVRRCACACQVPPGARTRLPGPDRCETRVFAQSRRSAERASRGAQHSMIMHEDDRCHPLSSCKVTTIRVPEPSADSTASSAPTAAARSRMIIRPHPWSFAGC